MNTHAKRNKYRGLQAYIAAHYDPMKDSAESLHAALQAEERWAGVELASVRTALSALRADKAPVYRKPAHRNGRTPALPNVLVTIPLPKRGTATMTVQQAFEVYKVLRGLFGDK